MEGWHFLTGQEDNIKKLADAAGFHYKYDPISKQFAHASGIMVLTPEGRIARYFYGIEYKPRDLRLGLVEASQHKIGSPVDVIMLFCYHYDPDDRQIRTGDYERDPHARLSHGNRFGRAGVHPDPARPASHRSYPREGCVKRNADTTLSRGSLEHGRQR